MNVLELFAGVGGLSTQWLKGWRTVCYVERAEYPASIIKARIRDGLLDDAPIWDDVGTFDGRPWRGFVNVVKAGFPCQPFSVAGKGLAGNDPRDGWPHTIRIIREVRPRFALLENVPGLLAGSHGYFGRILRELAESGYHARWRVLSAAELGAPHKRDRLWIIAVRCGHVADPQSLGRGNGNAQNDRPIHRAGYTLGNGGEILADAESGRCQPVWSGRQSGEKAGDTSRGLTDGRQDVADADGRNQYGRCSDVEMGRVPFQEKIRGNGEEWTDKAGGNPWGAEPGLGRVVNELADRLDFSKSITKGEF